MMQDFLFKASNISKYYGQNVGCKNISLDINSGEVLGIVGESGSGKSTLLKSIMGLIPIFGGKIYFKGNELFEIKSHELVQKGIAYVPQVSNVFQSLTIEENLEMGLWTTKKEHSNFFN